MAKKGSRKRKASATDTEAALEVIGDDFAAQQQGGATKEKADEDLFVFDTEPDNAAVHIPHSGRKRPRACKEKKLTRAQAILAASVKAVPFGQGAAFAAKKRTPASSEQPPSRLALEAARKPEPPAVEPGVVTLGNPWEAAVATDAWVEDAPVATRPKTTSRRNRPLIAAVEVDPAGCSYNPEYEQHQDAIAEAVAAEMSVQLAKELEPAAPPLTVTQAQFDLAEMALGLESDGEEEDEDNDAEGGAANAGDAARVSKKKTKKDRARAERRRGQDLAVSDKRALKTMRRDIDGAAALVKDISGTEQEYSIRQQRRQVVQEDKEKTLPPKLGRHKWQPSKLQVLASDDVNGSLRKLRTIPAVAKDRFNSLQKRGVVQVTVPQHWTKPTKRRVKQYEKGEVREKAAAGQKELEDLAKGNREREKKKKIKK